MSKMTIRDVDVKGKKCLTRVDFNVPMVDGVITDENRINGALPTIKYLMEHGAKVILCSHLGKPHNIFTPGFGLTKKEKKAVEALPENEREAAKAEYIAKALKNDPKKFSLKPVADRLAEIFPGKVTFATDLVGEDAHKKVAALKDGECVPVSTRAKRRTARSFARSSPISVTSTSTTPSAPRIARTPPRRASRSTALLPSPSAASSSRRSSSSWAVRWRTPWRESVRQDRRHREPHRQVRRAHHRRRHGIHLPRGAGI